MAIRLNEALKVSRSKLENLGVFNGFIDIDSRFYLDPFLLRNTEIPELKNSYKHFQKYFEIILKLVEKIKRENDVYYKTVSKLLRFKEIPNIALGYSKGTTRGNAIGKKTAKELTVITKDLVEEGVKDTEIFELIGLLQEGVGADRISDMTASIILVDLLSFTQRIVKNLKIKETDFYIHNDTNYLVPVIDKPIILLPKAILTPLPVAFDWEHIDVVCKHNAKLREKVNGIIGKSWKEALKVPKTELRETLLNNPQLVKDLVNVYKEKPIKRYDFHKDPSGQIIWSDISLNFASNYPLNLKRYKKVDKIGLIEFVEEISNQFKKLIENNGLNEVLYVNNKIRNERFAQLLFFGIADTYCKINDLDLSREPNAGSGPVDFKISASYKKRILVELKYSKNNIIKGYQKQLIRYQESEEAFYCFYIVLKVTKSERNINKLREYIKKNQANNSKIPQLIVIDALPKKSASKL